MRHLSLIMLCLGLSGCFQRQGLPVLNVSPQIGQVENKTAQSQNALTTIETDLDELQTLVETLQQLPDTTWREPFPLDLYRHALMSCLTLPLNAETVPDSPEANAAEALGVTCAVLPLPPLVEALAKDNGRQAATTGLQAVDAMREKRTILEARLRSMPRDLEDMREYVATQRAEARRVEQDLDRRKPEYLDKDFQASKSQLRAWRERLNTLEQAVEQLEARRPGWTSTMETRLAALYRIIATLGSP